MRSLKRKCVAEGSPGGARAPRAGPVTCQRSGRKRASLAVSEGLGRATGFTCRWRRGEMEDLVDAGVESPLERADAATDRAREECRG